MDAYETQLASEGGNASFMADREGLQIAFHERFALAVDAQSKRDVVRSALLPGSPEALYYSALCDLHEVQALVNEDIPEKDALAWRLVENNRDALLKTITELNAQYCHKKATRLQQRQLLLQLELQSRLKKPEAEILVCCCTAQMRSE